MQLIQDALHYHRLKERREVEGRAGGKEQRRGERREGGRGGRKQEGREGRRKGRKKEGREGEREKGGGEMKKYLNAIIPTRILYYCL